MHLLIPASGNATRMSGMPKFLLPLPGGDTLLKRHIDEGAKISNGDLHIATRSANVPAVASYLELNVPRDVRSRVRLHAIDSVTMTDTVMQMPMAGTCMVVMPDTYFPFDRAAVVDQAVGSDCSLVVFKIRPDQRGKLGQVKLSHGYVVDMVDKDASCEYEYAWGAVVFNNVLSRCMRREQPHIGYAVRDYLQRGGKVHAIIVDASYYDCGTIGEYTDLLLALRQPSSSIQAS
jgi:hypothetical protein